MGHTTSSKYNFRAVAFFLLVGAPLVLQAQTCALNILPGASVTLSNGTFSYCSVDISAGATLVIGGAVTLNVTGNVNIFGLVEGAPLGQALGYGSVYAPSPGPGAGGNESGGGHGGTGGGANGGVTYDLPLDPVDLGSMGGGTTITPQSGGAGGALFHLSAPSGNVTFYGAINMAGGVPLGYGCGGGAGGTISIDAQVFYGTGQLLAGGGTGGFAGGMFSAGGGGGGGRIRLCDTVGVVGYFGFHDVKGGQGGFGGMICLQCIGCPCFPSYGPRGVDGTFYTCYLTVPTPTPTVTMTPTPTFTATPACTGTFSISANLFKPSQESLSITAGSCAPGESLLKVYNTAGEEVKTLFSGNLSGSAPLVFPWNGTNEQGESSASGIYFIRLTSPFEVRSGRVMLIR
jgi:hypothetical protein